MKERKTGWKQGTDYKKSSEGLSSLVKSIFSLFSLSPIVFQGSILICAHTLVRNPLQKEYKSKLHLLDTNVTALITFAMNYRGKTFGEMKSHHDVA